MLKIRFYFNKNWNVILLGLIIGISQANANNPVTNIKYSELNHNMFNVGGLVGFSSLSNSGTSKQSLGLGIKGGYLINSDWEIGGEWTYMSTTPSTALIGYTSKLNLFTADVNYRFNEAVKGLYVGAKLGWAYTSAGGFNGSSLAAGGEIGYDYFFGQMSAGPQVNLLYVGGPSINDTSLNSSTLYQILAAVKYWL